MPAPHQGRVTPEKSCQARDRRNMARIGNYLKGGGNYIEKDPGGGFTIELAVTAISLTGTYNIDFDTVKGFLLVSPDSLGPHSINLPAATSVNEGKVLYVKNDSSTDSFNLDVVSSGTIDGVSGGTSIGTTGSAAVIAATADGGSREWYFLEEP